MSTFAALASGCSSTGGTGANTGGGANAGGTGATGTGATGTGASGTGATGTAGTGATGTAGTGASTTNGGGTSIDGGCGGTLYSAMPRPVNILVLVDKSGSMLKTPTGFTTNKWAAMRTALSSALTAVQSKLSVGLDFFPYEGGPDDCYVPNTFPPPIVVDVAPGTTSVPKITAAMNSNNPFGSTPTAAGLKRALDYFTSGAGKGLAGDKIVLLATDGGPNCKQGATCAAATCTVNMDGDCPAAAGNCCDTTACSACGTACLDESGAVQSIKDLAAAGIKTAVVGIPGTEVYSSTLTSFAVAGGVSATYFRVDASSGVQGLTDTLTKVTQDLVTSCNLQLTQDPPDPTKLTVSIDTTPVPRLDMSGNGWQIDQSTSPATLQFMGTACDLLKTKGANSVKIIFGCPVLPG
jgi:hypothetical protein